MNFIKRTLFILLALVAFLVALLAAADNSDEVALKFLDFQSPVWPISWWMLTAFVIGVLFGTVLNLIANSRLRLNARRANKKAEVRTKALDQLKADSSPAPSPATSQGG